MAWRIDEAVIRGEVDNRTRGRVTGRLWLVGRAEPVVLDLAGDCRHDLAGRRLEFTNPRPKAADLEGFASVQRGSAGELTASRKVRVPDIPMDQIGEYYAARKPFPSHWGNALYLEWFSDSNGRVVLETVEYELMIVGDPTWELTLAEEEIQRLINACDAGDLTEKPQAEKEEAEPAAETGDECQPPPSELEAERAQARSDLLADRVQARLAREGEAADYAKILEEEIERLRRELGEPEPSPEQLARNAEWLEEMNRAAEDLLADPEAGNTPQYEHPLAQRAFEFAEALSLESEDQAWAPKGAGEEHPVVELEGCVLKAAVKLAGALNHREWPPPLGSCASIIVRLKRARIYLDDALRAMESCQEEKLIPAVHLGPILVEVIDLAHDADEIIAELRERLAPGQ
jgi:hypothetical protein